LHVSSVRFPKYLINFTERLLPSPPQLFGPHEKFHRNKNIILGAELSHSRTEYLHAYMNGKERRKRTIKLFRLELRERLDNQIFQFLVSVHGK